MIVPAFERLVAVRYLRSRRREGFISVIAGFSLLGICLGVATLIVVLSVMNGFRQDVLNTILGVNGHLSLSMPGQNIKNFDSLAAQIRASGRTADTILVDASLYTGPAWPAGWEQSDIAGGSWAPIEPVMLDGGRLDPLRAYSPRSATPRHSYWRQS